VKIIGKEINMGRTIWKIVLLLSVVCVLTGCSTDSKVQDSKSESNIKDEKEAFYQGEIMTLKHAEYAECICSRDGREMAGDSL